MWPPCLGFWTQAPEVPLLTSHLQRPTPCLFFFLPSTLHHVWDTSVYPSVQTPAPPGLLGTL